MKKIAFIIISLFIGQAYSNPLQSAAETNFDVTVQGSCFFDSPLFMGNFGSIPSGEVGMTGVEIGLTCSFNSPYTIKPINDTATQTGGYNEPLLLKAYKNSSFTDQMTTSNVIPNTGSGVSQKMIVYFKLTGKGKDFGNGNGVVEKFDFSNKPFVYPLVVVY